MQTSISVDLAVEMKKVKCLVWDLDNTLWDGVLLEDEHVKLRPQVVEIVKELDNRGILLSVASKNEHQAAMKKLEEFGLSEYFLYPQINWNSKSSSIQAIQQSLNIGIDTFAFIDDQPFEREEVGFTHSQVLLIDAAELDTLLEMPQMNPTFITDDSKNRRLMYMADWKRNQAEGEFVGPTEEFLASLEMVMTIAPVGPDDLKRAEELTVRTNQLNTTGYTYSYEELESFSKSSDHKLLVASLDDKYGSYGKIGLALVECGAEVWNLKLLLMSCRVMSRGVGMIMLNHIMNLAKQHNVRLQAEFVSNNKNRMMYVTLKFAGFTEVAKEGQKELLENDVTRPVEFPEYVNISIIE